MATKTKFSTPTSIDKSYREDPVDNNLTRKAVIDEITHDKLDPITESVTLNSDNNNAVRVVITTPSLADTPGPSDITLTKTEISESASIGAKIADIIPLGGLGPYVFTLIDDPDSKFSVIGNELLVNDTLDASVSNQHSITIRVEDANSNTFNKSFIIDVLPVSAAIDYFVRLNGIDEDLTAPNIPELSGANTSWTICFTVTRRLSGRKIVLISQQTQFSNRRGLEIFLTDTGQVQVEYIENDATNTKLSKRTNNTLTLNTPSFVFIKYDGSKTAQGIAISVNDGFTPQSVLSNTGTNFDSGDTFIIGSGNRNRDYFQGDINNFLLFTGEVSDPDRTILYNNGNPLEDLSANPGLLLSNLVHVPITDSDVYPTLSDLRGYRDLTMNANMDQNNLIENI